MEILTKRDAENDPKEIGHDEQCVEPTEGRGIGDTLGALGLSMPDISLPNMFTMIRNVLIVVMVSMGLFFIMFLILAVK